MKLTSIDNKNLVGIYEKAINNKFSLEEKILIAKKAGFDFIEISIDESDEKIRRLDWTANEITEIRKILAKHNFLFNSMTLSAHRKYPFGSKDLKTRQKAKEIMYKSIILSRQLGIRTIQLAGYDVYYEQGDLETKNLFIEGIKWAVKLATKYSVVLAFETMDTKFLSTISLALEYTNKINSPYLNIYPDLGNLFQFTNNIEQELSLGKSKIIAFHFKDTKPNVFRNVPFGEGTVDFVRYFKHIKKLNIDVPVLIEMWSNNNQNEKFDEAHIEIKKAMNFYQNILKKAQNEN